PRPRFGERFPEHAACGEQHEIDGSEVVVLPVERHHHAKKKEVSETKEAKRPHGAMEKKKSQPGDPNKISDGIEHHDLLLDEWQRRQLDVLMHGFNVAEVFEGREVMRVLPN